MNTKTFWKRYAAAAVILGGLAVGTSGQAQGITWSAPAPLNANASYDNGADYTPRVATDGAGNWVAAWTSYWPNAVSGDTQDPDILTMRSTDNGVNWTTPAVLNTNAAVTTTSASAPRILPLGSGAWLAVWNFYNGSDMDVMFARSVDNGATWSAPQALNPDAATDSRDDYSPEIATDRAGNIIAVFHTLAIFFGPDSDSYYCRSTDNGVTWSPVAELNPGSTTDAVNDQDAEIVSLGAGKWVTAYTTYNDLGGPSDNSPDIAYRVSTDNGQSWSVPQFLNSDYASNPGYYILEQLAASGNTVIGTMTRASGNAGDTVLYAARSVNGGSSFSAPARVSRMESWPVSSVNEYSNLVTDGAGRWIISWSFQDYFAQSMQGDREVLFARSTDDGSTFSAQANLNDTAGTDSGYDGPPSLAAGVAGNWVSVWQTTDSRGGTIGMDGDILVARSTDHGAGWNATAVLNPHAGPDSGWDDINARLATDGASTAFAVWDSSGLPDIDIKFAKSLNGGLTWTAPANVQTNSGIDGATDTKPEAAHVGGTSWIAAWQVSSSSTYGSDGDILAARTVDGGNSWSVTTPISPNATSDSINEGNMKLAGDHAGTAIAIWDISFGEKDVYAARTTNGGASWNAAAAVNPNATTDSFNDQTPTVAHSGGSNWLAAWASSNDLGGTIGTDPDILVARSTDGGASWGAPIALNTNASSDGSAQDLNPYISTDGAGNCVAVWKIGGFSSVGIRAAYSTNYGATWSAPVIIATVPSSGAAFVPEPNTRVVFTGGDSWILVYTRRDPNWVSSSGSSQDNDVYYAQSLDNGATWSTPALLNTNGVSSDDQLSEEDPSITATSSRWIVSWSLACGAQGGPFGTDKDSLFATAPASVSGVSDWPLY